MATSYSPKIITDGLVLCLDAADKKSLLAPPTTNLANNSNGTINWTTADLGATVRTQSTVDVNSYHYRFVLDKGSGNNAQLRFAFDHTNLTNGETYIISYKYKITSGSGSFYTTDFCDQSVTRVTTDIGDGWYYETAYGTRSSYTETYDFFDTLATENMTVDIKEIQVEHTSSSSPLATPFVSYQRQWKDRAGSNNGTPENMSDQSNFSSEGGGSLIFDGSNDYIDFGNRSLISDDFCIDICYKLTSVKSEHYIFTTGYSSSGSILIYSGGIWLNSSVTNGRMPGAPGGTINEITNITVERTNGVAKWYKNGVFQYSLNYSGAISTNTNYSIGWAVPRNKSTAYMSGKFYSVKIYNKGFSASEVLQNYNATKGRFGL